MDVAPLLVEAQDHVSANDRVEQLEAARTYPPDDVVDAEVKGCSCARTGLQALEAVRCDNPAIDRRWHLHHEGTGRGTQGARGVERSGARAARRRRRRQASSPDSTARMTRWARRKRESFVKTRIR